MKRDFFTHLRSYSFDPEKIDRIIVSNFLYSNNIENCKNHRVERLRIKEYDADYCDLKKVLVTYSIASIEDLIEAFEFVISPEEKVVTGAVYTPKLIREFIVNNVILDKGQIDLSTRLCDPACGCSGFLYTAAKRIKDISGRSYSDIFRDNLFGLDTQEFSIRRSELLLTLAAIVDGEDKEAFKFNLHVGNALDFDWSKHIEGFTGFDSVIGNPPYVCSRNIEEESKSLIQNWSVSSSGHPDLYIPFFEIGISILKQDASLGYISMNSFFKSVNGRALRKYFNDRRLSIEIMDFGALQVFQSKSTYTCICLIKNTHSNTLKYMRLAEIEDLLKPTIGFRNISYEDLNADDGWNLQEREVLNRIQRTGKPFGERFTTRNGVATLKNDVYIFDPVRQDDDFYYLQNDGLYSIERDACVDVINPNKLTQVDSIEGLRKKIIFPYQFKNKQPSVIPEAEFRRRFPNAYNYLFSKKEVLATRDKGGGRFYEPWFIYGRNQSLEHYPFKLFFPHIAPATPNFVFNDEPGLLFVNGLAIVGDNERELQLARKVMSSRLFWFYVVNSSKPYGSGYYSLSRNYIKNFGIYDFTEEEIDLLIGFDQQEEVDQFLEQLYDIDLSKINIFAEKESSTSVDIATISEPIPADELA